MRLLPFVALAALVLAACASAPATLAPLPAGDAAHGAQLFTESVDGAPACSTCHTIDGTPLEGPSMQGFSERASTRVQGLSAQDYAHTSILQPSAYLVSGFSNTMYNQFGQHLSSQDIADLIAYLLTL
jgi:cytochrome c oxidase subunit 2